MGLRLVYGKSGTGKSTFIFNEIKEKMWPLDVGELFMVGKKTAEKLKIMNINTIPIKAFIRFISITQ